MTKDEKVVESMNALDFLTAELSTTKKTAAAKLTPVGAEASSFGKPVIPDVPQVFLTQEALRDIAIDLRRQAGMLIDVADGLDGITQTPTVPPLVPFPSADELRKQAEKDADEAAEERAAIKAESSEPVNPAFETAFKQLQEAAQASVFTQENADGKWTCPVHDLRVEKESKLGRPYGRCPECKEFEHLV